MTPLVYHYHPDTHIYIGVTEAIESPLEPGVFLCPAHATLSSPALEILESQVNVWDNNNSVWTQQERFPPTFFTHTFSIPEPVPEEPAPEEPAPEEPAPEEPAPEEPAEPIPDAITQLRWMRDNRLTDVDWVAIKYFTLGMPYPTEWKTYVQALRDLPATSEELAVDEKGRLLVASVVWPTRPSEN